MSDQSRRRSSRPFWLGEDRRQWDHVRLHIQIYKDGRMGAYEQAVYGGIAIHAELQTGEACPSLETLAGYAKCDERTVRRVIKRLRQWGYIEVDQRIGMASVYRLLPPPTLDSQSEVGDKTPDTGVGGTPDSQSGVEEEGADTESEGARTDVPGTADTESDELDRALEREFPLTPSGGDWRKVPRSEARKVECPKCSARPGSPCRREDGGDREANHAERVMAYLTAPQEELERRRERIRNCQNCGGRGLVDLPDGSVARCPQCRSEALPA